nr:hypothetical protein [Tanacetum cinerariifolium]
AGVAAGRADHGDVAGAALEEFLEQEAEQLQRDVLERQRRAVEQLEQPLIVIELHQWRHRGMGEAAISGLAQLGQLGAGER